MTELFESIRSIISQPVFWPAIAVVVVFPILLVVCTELARFFDARGSSAAVQHGDRKADDVRVGGENRSTRQVPEIMLTCA